MSISPPAERTGLRPTSGIWTSRRSSAMRAAHGRMRARGVEAAADARVRLQLAHGGDREPLRAHHDGKRGGRLQHVLRDAQPSARQRRLDRQRGRLERHRRGDRDVAAQRNVVHRAVAGRRQVDVHRPRDPIDPRPRERGQPAQLEAPAQRRVQLVAAALARELEHAEAAAQAGRAQRQALAGARAHARSRSRRARRSCPPAVPARPATTATAPAPTAGPRPSRDDRARCARPRCPRPRPRTASFPGSGGRNGSIGSFASVSVTSPSRPEGLGASRPSTAMVSISWPRTRTAPFASRRDLERAAAQRPAAVADVRERQLARQRRHPRLADDAHGARDRRRRPEAWCRGCRAAGRSGTARMPTSSARRPERAMRPATISALDPGPPSGSASERRAPESSTRSVAARRQPHRVRRAR